MFFQDETSSDIYCKGKKVSPKIASSFEFQNPYSKGINKPQDISQDNYNPEELILGDLVDDEDDLYLEDETPIDNSILDSDLGLKEALIKDVKNCH